MLLSVAPQKMALVSFLALAGVAMLSEITNDVLGMKFRGPFLESSATSVSKNRRLLATDYALVGEGSCQGHVDEPTQSYIVDVAAGDAPYTSKDQCLQHCEDAGISICTSFEWTSYYCDLYNSHATSTTGQDGVTGECYNNVRVGYYEMQASCSAGCDANPNCAGFLVEELDGIPDDPYSFSFYCQHFYVDEDGNPAGEGIFSDPLITGLQGQIFKFDGRSDAWYANIASKSLQWNVNFHTFDSCPKEEDTFVTGSSINLLDPNPTGANGAVQSSDNVFVSVQQQDTFANAGVAALGGGNVIIKLGSQDIVTPGDYTLRTVKGDIRVVAHNTYAACSRKWYDYDHKPYAASIRGEDSPTFGRRRLSLHKVKQPIDYLLDNKDAWIDSDECTKWIEERKDNNDLFQQVGDWSTIYIETPLITYQMELRQNKADNAESCAYASLDTYITEMSPELEAEDFRGILGETKSNKKYNYKKGTKILLHRSDALEYKNDEAYEVDGPFGFAFDAREPRIESDIAVKVN